MSRKFLETSKKFPGFSRPFKKLRKALYAQSNINKRETLDSPKKNLLKDLEAFADIGSS